MAELPNVIEACSLSRRPLGRGRTGVRGWILALIATFLLSAAVHAQVQSGGAVPVPIFPADNWWNLDISAAPLDSNSAAYINFIGTTRALHPDLGGDVSGSFPQTYGMPYVVVPGTQPLRPVTFDYADESDYAAPGRPAGYPIPDEAKTQVHLIEGGWSGADPAASGDRHMLILDRDNRLLYELFALRWNSALGRWEAGSGAIFSLDSNARRPEGWTSADAAGLAIFPGLIRYDEAYGTAPIRHAFRVTVRATNGYVYPASHRAGSTAGALPMGARLRLKASKDISSFTPAVQRVFQAMKTYGLIVADNGSDMYITGTYDNRWDNSVLNPAFRALKASDFEVVQLGWRPSTPPPCPLPAISVQPAGTTVAAGQQATLTVTASSTTPLSYQWYRGLSGDVSQAIAGTNSAAINVTPQSTTSYWVRLGNACGTTNSNTATVNVTSPPPGGSGVKGDFNGDGRVDLVWRHYSTGDVHIWLMNGTGYTTSVVLPRVHPIWRLEGAADFNGDRHTDLLWRNSSTGENSVWLMNGTSRTSAVALRRVQELAWKIQATGDFNGDGQTDIVWRHYGVGANVIWLMNGTNYVSTVEIRTVPESAWQIEASGDFNRDGHTDLVWRHYGLGINVIWLMNRTTYSSTVEIRRVLEAEWRIESAGDYNGDGNADLMWRHYGLGANTIWLMDATTYQSSATIRFVEPTQWEVGAPR
jgi:hypothetical protein